GRVLLQLLADVLDDRVGVLAEPSPAHPAAEARLLGHGLGRGALPAARAPAPRRPVPRHLAHQSTFSTARNASCGISTFPTAFIRRLPSFCRSRSFFLRVMSPP